MDIESGSKIKASTQASDYDYANCELDPVGVCDRISPLLFADNVENIGIQGQGIIEGVGMTLYCASGQLCEWGNCGYGITAIFYGDVSNGFITNIRVQNTGGAAVVIAESNDILIDSIEISSLANDACNDGLDIFGSQHVIVRNSNIESHDDNIALKMELPYGGGYLMSDYNLESMEDILIENNTVYAPNAGWGLKIGWSVQGNLTKVTFKNNVIRTGNGSDIGLQVRNDYVNSFGELSYSEYTRVHNIHFIDNWRDHVGGDLVPYLSISNPAFKCIFYDVWWNGKDLSIIDDFRMDNLEECDSPTVDCSCTEWQNQGMGEGICPDYAMLQTRECSPSGCGLESRCLVERGSGAGSSNNEGWYDENISDPDDDDPDTNSPPLPNSDSYSTDENSQNNQFDVLANDSDPNNDTLTISAVSESGHGTVSFDANYIYYTPDNDYVGQDEFSYSASDGELSATATVTVYVKKVEDPNTNPTDPRVVSYWTFDESNPYADLIGNNHGSSSGSYEPLIKEDGKFNKALYFDGSDDYVDVGNFDVAGDEITIMAWVNPDVFWTYPRIVAKVDNSDKYYFSLNINGNGQLYSKVCTKSSTKTVIASTAMLTHKWSFVVMVYDGAALKLYLNGQKVGEASLTGNLLTNSQAQVWLGNSPPSSFNHVLYGCIDEVAILDAALTNSEVEEFYQAQGYGFKSQ